MPQAGETTLSLIFPALLLTGMAVTARKNPRLLSVDEESVLHQQVTSGLDPDATRLARIISQRHILGVDDLRRALIRARTHRGGNGLLPRVLQRLLTTGAGSSDRCNT